MKNPKESFLSNELPKPPNPPISASPQTSCKDRSIEEQKRWEAMLDHCVSIGIDRNKLEELNSSTSVSSASSTSSKVSIANHDDKYLESPRFTLRNKKKVLAKVRNQASRKKKETKLVDLESQEDFPPMPQPHTSTGIKLVGVGGRDIAYGSPQVGTGVAIGGGEALDGGNGSCLMDKGITIVGNALDGGHEVVAGGSNSVVMEVVDGGDGKEREAVKMHANSSKVTFSLSSPLGQNTPFLGNVQPVGEALPRFVYKWYAL